MATLTKKRKLAAVSRETQENTRNSQKAQHTFTPEMTEEYITQLCGETAGKSNWKTIAGI